MNYDLTSIFEAFKENLARYDAFVRLNPRLAAEIEAIIRWSSYLVATRKSPILGELLTSGANLIQLCNDIILRQANPELKLTLNSCVTQLKTFLGVVQSLELLAEIYARDTYGKFGKWAIITVIQITKAAIKLVLLLVFDDGLTKSQYIVPLDRIHYSEIVKLQEKFGRSNSLHNDSISQAGPSSIADTSLPSDLSSLNSDDSISTNNSLVLKSSGRRMRSLKESPMPSIRASTNNKHPQGLSNFDKLQKQRLMMLISRYRDYEPANLTDFQLCGEILHISRPLAHLALMGLLGTKSWLPYMTSLLMDISSLYMVRTPKPESRILNRLGSRDGTALSQYRFNVNERMELGHRASSLLLYLLRSPFFDRYTKQRALEGLAEMAENIPLFGHFLATFVNYIPEWQKDYFRVWSG